MPTDTILRDFVATRSDDNEKPDDDEEDDDEDGDEDLLSSEGARDGRRTARAG